MTDTKSHKLARSGLWLTSGFAIERISQLVAQIILARILVPEDFGIWGMVLILIRLSTHFRDKATASVLVYKGLEDRNIVDTVYSLSINISLGMFFLQSFLGYPLGRFLGEAKVFPLTLLTSLVFILGAGAGTHGAVLQQRLQFKELAIAEVIASISRFGSTIFAAFLGFGVWSFAIGEISMALMESIFKRYFSQYSFKYIFKHNPDTISEVTGYISKIISGNIAVYANTNSDNLIIGKLLGATELGYYNLAYQFAMLPTFALAKINQITFATLSKMDEIGKQNFLRRIFELYALVNAPIYGLGWISAPWLIPTLYGPEWKPAIQIFKIILIFAYTRGFMAILGVTLNSLNHPGMNALINWLLVPVAASAFYLGAIANGTTGVAIAASLTLGIGATAWFILATHHITRWNLLKIILPSLMPGLAIILSITSCYILPFHQDTKYILQAIVLLATYFFIISIFNSKRLITKALASLISSQV